MTLTLIMHGVCYYWKCTLVCIAEPPVSEPFPFIPSTVILWISLLLSASASTGSNRQPQFLGKCCMCCIMCIVSIMYSILIIFHPVADFLLHTLDKVVCPFPGQVLRHASMASRKWGYPGRLGDDGCSSGHVSPVRFIAGFGCAKCA